MLRNSGEFPTLDGYCKIYTPNPFAGCSLWFGWCTFDVVQLLHCHLYLSSDAGIRFRYRDSSWFPCRILGPQPF